LVSPAANTVPSHLGRNLGNSARIRPGADVSPERDRRRGVSQVVEADPAEPKALERRAEHPRSADSASGAPRSSVKTRSWCVQPGDRLRSDVRLAGAARVFEANVNWRLRSARG
jgi:hypothetical protein